MNELGISQEYEFTIPRNRDGNLSWKHVRELPEEVRVKLVQQEADSIIPADLHFTTNYLRKAGFSGFTKGVNLYYPGGLRGLRADMGRDGQVVKRQPNGHWTQEKIEEEAANFLQLRADLSNTTLKEAGRGDLARAVTRYYPGGMPILRELLGLKAFGVPRYWTQERIEKEAQSIFQSEGNITFTYLAQTGRSGLASAISSKYPESYFGLRKKLGITADRKPNGYWNIEKIIEEAVSFIEKHGTFTSRSLIRNGRNDLAVVVNKNYPGGIQGLREKLEINYSTSDKSISPDAANEQLRGLLEGGLNE